MGVFRQVRWALAAVIAVALVLMLVLWLPGAEPQGDSAPARPSQQSTSPKPDRSPVVETPGNRVPGRAMVQAAEAPQSAPARAQRLQVQRPEKSGTVETRAVDAGDKRPALAIVIDDMAYSAARFNAANQLPREVSFAFLPDVEGVADMARSAFALGRDLLVHLPMEPFGPVANPGPGALMVADNAAVWETRLQDALTSFDGYVGINNHMGSRATADPKMMKWLMTALKSRGLSFLDSKTTPKSVAELTARSHGVPTAARHIFLDPDGDGSVAAQQFDAALRLARGRGSVIVICHPYPKTLAFLARTLRNDDPRYRLVPISHLLK